MAFSALANQRDPFVQMRSSSSGHAAGDELVGLLLSPSFELETLRERPWKMTVGCYLCSQY